MASRTWLGSSDPDVQAEPDDAQMPFAVQQQEQWTLALDAFKAEVHIAGQAVLRGSPLSTRVRNFRQARRSDWSRRAVTLAMFSSICSQASSQSRRHAHDGRPTFSVPARLPLSCAPPSIRLIERNALARSTARRCPSGRGTCAPRATACQCSALRTLIGRCPAACTASVWKITPALAADRADLGNRQNRADLVVCIHHRHEAGILDGWQSATCSAVMLPLCMNIQQCRSQSPAFSAVSRRVQDGMVLKGGGNDMLFALASRRAWPPADRIA